MVEIPIRPALTVASSTSSVRLINSPRIDNEPVGELSDEEEVFDADTSSDIVKVKTVKRGEVMTHMRADCPVNAFRKVKHTLTMVIVENEAKCDKCFCYICDVK